MPIGRIVRALAGPKFFRVLGCGYRRVFMRLELLIGLLSELTPPGASILDIGGGDGAPVNGLVAVREDVSVIMIDPGPAVGGWVEERYHFRVRRCPKVTLQAFLDSGAPLPDVVFILDVIHHIPVGQRPAFFAALNALLEQKPDTRILIKDVEPGYLRSTLGLWSDVHVTGDKHVRLLPKAALIADLERHLGSIQCRETALFVRDRPNYLIEVRRIPPPGLET